MVLKDNSGYFWHVQRAIQVVKQIMIDLYTSAFLAKTAYLHVCICIVTEHPILRTFHAFLAILGSAKTAYFNVSHAYLLSIRFERTFQGFFSILRYFRFVLITILHIQTHDYYLSYLGLPKQLTSMYHMHIY